MPGRVIAVCAAAAFVAFLIYGLSFDVRGRLAEHRRAVEARRALRRVIQQRDRDLAELHQRALELQRVSDEITWVAEAMAEIRNLPTAAGR